MKVVMLMIVISIVGFVFGREAAQNRIVETTQGLIGRESAQMIGLISGCQSIVHTYSCKHAPVQS